MKLSRGTLLPLLGAWMVLSLALLACGASAPPASSEQPVAAMPTQVSGGEQPAEESPSEPDPAPLPTHQPLAATALPSIPERRYLTLEFPPRIRVGDSDVVRLTLEVDDLGNITPTAQIEGNVVTGDVIEIPNLYETHFVIAESQFDIAGLQVSPPELSSQTLEQGQTVSFFWSVRPSETGVYRGTIWLFLRFVDKQNGEERRKAVSAQLVEIEAVNLFGLSANFARATGMVGSLVGAVIGFPFFDDVLKWLWKRRPRRSA